MLPGLSLSILKDDNRWSELSSHEWTSDLIFDILQDCTPLFNLNIDTDGKAVQRGITVLGSTWSSRFIFLDYFRLIILILTSIADSLQARINSNPEALLEFPADVIQKEYDPDEPSLRRCIQVICSHALFVTLQDDIVTTVNQSDIMRDFRVKVSSMLELLLRNEDSDLLIRSDCNLAFSAQSIEQALRVDRLPRSLCFLPKALCLPLKGSVREKA
jgi:hypothetical protein